MENSLWQESVRHWKQSMCVWCCMLAGVVTLAQSKPPSAASLVLATASGAVAVKAADHSATPATAVTLRYEHFDLSALSASSYGDNEH